MGGELIERRFFIGSQDGHSHLLVYPIPNCVAYDPAYAFELAVIVRDGIRRMYVEQESVFFYLTVGNEQYAQPGNILTTASIPSLSR